MIRGRVVGLVLIVAAMIAGMAIYWLQVYAFYFVPTEEEAGIAVAGMPVEVTRFEAIDATSSPIRFRACFRLEGAALEAALAASSYPDPTPLNPPPWFECFQSVRLIADIASGEARAVLGARNVGEGVDLVLAVYPDGRAYAWRQLNETWRD